MNRSTPGLPVHHQFPEFTQTHAHRVGDAIQPSHPLLSPSPPAPNPCKHLEPGNLEVSARKQLQKLGLHMCAQTLFWEIPVSLSEAGGECKDGIL